jgi:hypothetical protein
MDSARRGWHPAGFPARPGGKSAARVLRNDARTRHRHDMWLLRALMVVERVFPGIPSWLRPPVEVVLIGIPIALIAHYIGGRSGGPQDWSGAIAAGVEMGVLGMLICEWTVRKNRS